MEPMALKTVTILGLSTMPVIVLVSNIMWTQGTFFVGVIAFVCMVLYRHVGGSDKAQMFSQTFDTFAFIM